MTFSKSIIDDIKDYFVANVEANLLLVEAEYSVTINRAVHFDIYNYKDNQFPFAMVYETRTPYEMETIDRDLKRFGMAFDVVDSRMELAQLRNNLYGYRDAIAEIIESRSGKNLGGAIPGVVQSYITEILPAAVIKEPANYTGFTAIKFTVEVI